MREKERDADIEEGGRRQRESGVKRGRKFSSVAGRWVSRRRKKVEMIKMNSTETRPFHGIFFHSILRKACRDWRSMIFRSFLYNVNGDRSTREAVPRIEEAWICRGSLWQRIRGFILKLTKNGTWYASHNAIFWWNADKETLPRSIATRFTPAHRSFSPALANSLQSTLLIDFQFDGTILQSYSTVFLKLYSTTNCLSGKWNI